MAISDVQRAAITQQLTEYCAPDPRPEVRRQLRHGFEVGPSEVVLFEERPRFGWPTEWLRHDVAKFRWVETRREWQLYCQLRDLGVASIRAATIGPYLRGAVGRGRGRSDRNLLGLTSERAAV